jgi:hypothetical protein
MSPASPGLRLAFGFRFDDLYSVAGLERLDGEFLRALGEADAALAARLSAARHDPAALAYREEAELLIAAAPHLDRFIARLFGIEDEWVELVESHHRLAPLFRVKRKFVQRRAMLKIKADEAAGLDGPALEAEVARRLGGKFEELAFANAILEWQKDEPAQSASPPGPRTPTTGAGATATASSSSLPNASILSILFRCKQTRAAAIPCTRCTTFVGVTASP